MFILGTVSEEGNICAQQAAQWCPPQIVARFENKVWESFRYEQILGTEAYEQLKEGKFLQKAVIDLPEEKQACFLNKNILSFLMIPLTVNDEF